MSSPTRALAKSSLSFCHTPTHHDGECYRLRVPRRVVVPQKFRLARTLSGMTQRQLAAKAEVSEALVAMIEIGARSPSPFRAGRLASAMGVEVGTFMVDR